MEVVSQFKKLRGKQVKVVYREHLDGEAFTSEGLCMGCNPSFIVIKGRQGFAHFIALSSVIRISERRAEVVEY